MSNQVRFYVSSASKPGFCNSQVGDWIVSTTGNNQALLFGTSNSNNMANMIISQTATVINSVLNTSNDVNVRGSLRASSNLIVTGNFIAESPSLFSGLVLQRDMSSSATLSGIPTTSTVWYSSSNKIYSTQFVGINGQSNPSYPLDVNGTIFTNNSMVVKNIASPTAQLIVGGTTAIPGTQAIAHIYTGATDSVAALGTYSGSTSNASVMEFINPNGLVGKISTSNNTTFYTTTSDYRIKRNVSTLSNALEKIMRLQPRTYTFVNDVDNNISHGFIAHEVADVLPEAVLGEKDGKDFQTVDLTKLVPLLTAAIQELVATMK